MAGSNVVSGIILAPLALAVEAPWRMWTTDSLMSRQAGGAHR
jgi:hypothetical protein